MKVGYNTSAARVAITSRKVAHMYGFSLLIPLADQFALVQQQLSRAVLADRVIPVRVVGFKPKWVQLQGWAVLAQGSSELITHFQNYQGCLLNTFLQALDVVPTPDVHTPVKGEPNALFLLKVTLLRSGQEALWSDTMNIIAAKCRAHVIRELKPEDAMRIFGPAISGESEYFVAYTRCESLEEGHKVLTSLATASLFTEVIALLEEK